MLRALTLILPALLFASCASAADPDDQLLGGPSTSSESSRGGSGPRASSSSDESYSEDEVVSAVEEWLGVSAETAGSLVEKVFSELGRPNAYIMGGEGSGAIGVGLRYGDGTLVTKTGERRKVYWQGPTAGFDVGGNASKMFVLVYNLRGADDIYRRFPGVEGSLYFIGGVGVNYQRAEGVTLAPLRVGVGFREGVNVGYLSYSRKRNILPF